MAKTYKIGRSAISGKYTSVSTAVRHPKTHVVETVKKRRRR
ncbi:hypothetical protein [Mesorhizobium sp. KR2-14]